MSGFEAISQANGWVMAVLGATIVFSGLAALAITISLLPHVLRLIDKLFAGRKESDAPSEDSTKTNGADFTVPVKSPSDLRETAKLYGPMLEKLSDEFQLTELYSLCRKYDFPHPHLTLSCFRQANFLVETKSGYFRWNRELIHQKE